MQAQHHIQTLFATEDAKHARRLASIGSGIETNHRWPQEGASLSSSQKCLPTASLNDQFTEAGTQFWKAMAAHSDYTSEGILDRRSSCSYATSAVLQRNDSSNAAVYQQNRDNMAPSDEIQEPRQFLSLQLLQRMVMLVLVVMRTTTQGL